MIASATGSTVIINSRALPQAMAPTSLSVLAVSRTPVFF